MNMKHILSETFSSQFTVMANSGEKPPKLQGDMDEHTAVQCYLHMYDNMYEIEMDGSTGQWGSKQ